MDALTDTDSRTERGKENCYSAVNYATENYRTEDYGSKRDYSQYGYGNGNRERERELTNTSSAFPYGDRTYGERTDLIDCTDMNESMYSTSLLTHTSGRGSGRGREEDVSNRIDYYSRNY